MQHDKIRPAECEPGSMQDRTKELGARLRLSRERLMASDLRRNTRAWRLWAVCVEATTSWTRAADMTYATTLGKEAGIERQVACQLLLQFGQLGIFEWEGAARGSRDWRRLALPALPASRGQSGTAKEPANASRGQSGTANAPVHGVKVAPLHSYELSTEPHVAESHWGDQVGTPGQGAQGGALNTQGSEHHGLGAGTPEGTPRGTTPADLSGMTREQLAALARADATTHDAIKAELARREAPAEAADPYAELSPGVRRVFGLDNPHGYHGDERTGDGVGDDERSQRQWRRDNPSKVRARERAQRQD